MTIVPTESSPNDHGHDQEMAVTTNEGAGHQDFNYITGWRLHLITAALFLGIFGINFEITIVSTATVSITNDLHGFSQSSWLITAYLITYIAGLVIWARLSDLLGRKPTCVAAIIIFTAFSAGCGASQTMVQLIVCRAFQGIGGSGMYAISMVMIYELVPPPKYPAYTATAIAIVALANATGPIFGGLITERSSWIWVFLLNIPIGVVAGGLLLFAVPGDFPYQGRFEERKLPSLKNMDLLGALLMLATIVLVITGLEQAASSLTWTSAKTLGPLCASAVAVVAFLGSQYWHSSRLFSLTEPVFPWRFCRDRVIMGLILSSFMSGAVSITFIFQLPLRYQTAAGLDPLQAGLRLLPFSLSGPAGSILSAVSAKKLRIPPIYIMLFGSVVQTIGIVIASRGPRDEPAWPALYGLEVAAGLGFGFCLGAATLMTPFVFEKRDLAVGTAATVQFRFLGGNIVVSIVTAVGNSWMKNALSGEMTWEQISAIFRSTEVIETLPPSLSTLVREDFVGSFNLQMEIVLGFTVAGILTTLLMWQRPQLQVS